MPNRQGRGHRDNLKRPSIVAHNTQGRQDADAPTAPARYKGGSLAEKIRNCAAADTCGGNLKRAAGRDDTGPPRKGDPVFACLDNCA